MPYYSGPIPQECLSFEFTPDYTFPYIPPKLRTRYLVRTKTSTTEQSVTKTAPQIQALEGNERLRRIIISSQLWDLLLGYAVPRVAQQGQETTLDVAPDMQPESSAKAKFAAINSFKAYALQHEDQEDTADSVSRKSAARAAIWRQIDDPLKYFINQRYNCVARELNLARNTIVRESYPIWMDAVPAHHRRKDAKDKKKNAGIPDYVLVRGRKNTDNCAVIHAKPHWVYPGAKVWDFFCGGEKNFAEDEFRWKTTSVGGKMIRQLWGSLVCLSCDFGFWTNGRYCFAATRIDDALICSPLKPWDEERVHGVLAGLTYAAVDQPLWAVRGQDIRELLTPENSRRVVQEQPFVAEPYVQSEPEDWSESDDGDEDGEGAADW